MTNEQHYTTGQAAKIIGVRIHQIHYAVASGYVDGSSCEFMRKNMWTEDDVARLKNYFDKRKISKNGENNEI